MERIAVAGLSIHEVDVEGLEGLKRRAGENGETSLELADALGASELVLISTCNRFEVVFAREAGPLPRPEDLGLLATTLDLGEHAAARLTLHTGLDAARYVFRVTSSLESLVIGEDQILGQVRGAFERAEARRLTGRLLGSLFRHAIEVGKEVRSRTDLSRHPTSVVRLGTLLLVDRLRGREPSIAVVGAGHMGALAVRTLRGEGLGVDWIVNRTLPRCVPLAEDAGARPIELDAFRRLGAGVDALVSATSSPGFVFSADELRSLAARTPGGRPLVAVDLAVPRDLEPVDDDRIEIIDIDSLRERAEKNRLLRAGAIRKAEELIERKLETYRRRNGTQQASRALDDLRTSTHDVLEHEMSGLFRGRLAGLEKAERDAVERWARMTFGRLEHEPIRVIKSLVDELADQDRPGIDGAAGDER